MADTLLCCDDSRRVNEPLPGTAPRADVWLLLEHHAPWAAKAFEASALPEAVKTRLSGWLETIPNARMQFIKNDSRAEMLRFYVALCPQARLYRFDLAAVEDLLALDVPALAGGAPGFEAQRSDERLFLVCTNGKRDACCATYGLPLYTQMRALAGESVWQVTHIGGHRFAGTFVCLPHGIYYGRVADPAPVIHAYRWGDLHPDGCRGRCTLDAAAQAAELHLREQTGLYALDALRFVGLEQQADTWTAHFEASAEMHTVALRAEGFEVLESTGDPERKRVAHFAPFAHDSAGG